MAKAQNNNFFDVKEDLSLTFPSARSFFQSIRRAGGFKSNLMPTALESVLCSRNIFAICNHTVAHERFAVSIMGVEHFQGVNPELSRLPKFLARIGRILEKEIDDRRVEFGGPCGGDVVLCQHIEQER